MPGFNLGQLRAIRLRLPPLALQKTIAGLLGSMDDLIESNRRRIELLEQMAQAIYREWFVHFRYPGHENNELVDSPLGPIPSGWSATRLGDVVELAYGKALKADSRRTGDVVVVGSSGPVGSHDTPLCSGPTVVVGRKGNVGSVIWVNSDCYPIDTTFYVRTELPLRFVYQSLRVAEFINSHAAVPGLSREQAYGLPFLSPMAPLVDRYEEITSPLDRLAATLAASNEVLGSLRDLLLPKLVTGEIDVSNLDLDGVLEKAGV